ncbi:MAG: MurR/RpiR family transcriptional regulator [Desulfobacterales bacterium]|jgi:DNA-binding MurR/RpiR family transcriptional regulator|nr:MurR/RpiR family transcriptional regulator [Desulfobacterales bacterium]
MSDQQSHPTMKGIVEQHHSLTPKARILGNYILQNPRKAVFMTTKELAQTCQVSEATVVRFVSQLGYKGYGAFQQALRDFVDTELTMLDRTDLSSMTGPDTNRLGRVVFEEMENLKLFLESVDMDILNKIVDFLEKSNSIYVIGSRLSFTFAYYLGWSLTKIRQDVHILKGSDSTTIDWLTIAAPESLVIIIATTRYPNELIRLGKMVRRLGQTLIVIADSSLCPLTQFAHLSLVAPSKNIPFIGNPTTISCIINYLVLELASRNGDRLKKHQEKMEQAYRENDILFNLYKEEFAKK